MTQSSSADKLYFWISYPNLRNSYIKFYNLVVQAMILTPKHLLTDRAAFGYTAESGSADHNLTPKCLLTADTQRNLNPIPFSWPTWFPICFATRTRGGLEATVFSTTFVNVFFSVWLLEKRKPFYYFLEWGYLRSKAFIRYPILSLLLLATSGWWKLFEKFSSYSKFIHFNLYRHTY